jgi:anti-anti-sigma regulatory factor
MLGQYFDVRGDSESLEERAILLEEIRDPALRAVVFDFAQVEYFNSLVPDILCQVWNRVRKRDAKMAVCNLLEVGHEILSTSRLDSLWPPHASRPCAVEALRSTENAIRLP